MIELDMSFKELLDQCGKLTFLVGAGCSADPPSNLPLGRKMIEAIVRHSCAKSEVDKILAIEDLRFEQVVEIVRDRLDPKLKIIDYYGECESPNLQHFFLAEMLKRGHFVVTTNFDFLIELALLKLLSPKVPEEVIVPVITEEDYKNPEYQNPNKLFKKGKMAIYKIHGSTENAITGEKTRESLIATIQAFGSGNEGESVFQLEPFKRPAFEALSDGHSLVILGYSGSDDFDIVPTLKLLKGVENIVWVDHAPDDSESEGAFEIEKQDTSSRIEPTKINEILSDIKKRGTIRKVYLVKGNTSTLLRSVAEPSIELLESEPYEKDLGEWLEENLKSPSPFQRYQIPFMIYDGFSMVNEAMEACYEILRRAIQEGNDEWKGVALNNIGEIYRTQGNYPEALSRYEEALAIAEQLGDLSKKAIHLNNIASIHYAQGNYPEALSSYEEALAIDEQLGDLSGKATRLNNIGEIYRMQGNYPEALSRYEEALAIAEQFGDLSGKANCLNNIGEIYRMQGNYPEALSRYEEALAIAKQLGDLSGKATRLNNIASIHYAQGNYPKALSRYEEALAIAEQLGDLSKKATLLSNIASIHYAQGNYHEALSRYEKALAIDEQFGDLSGKATRLNNIGLIYKTQGNYPKALSRYEEALTIAEQLGDLSKKATRLNNIASIHYAQGNYPEALSRYEEALAIDEQLGDLSGKATRLNNIGMIYDAQGNYSEALSRYEEALKILIKLELGETPNAKVVKKKHRAIEEQDEMTPKS
ncbi:MAG: tetratricopeptide repeat protein [Promethearchaeota archaeon]